MRQRKIAVVGPSGYQHDSPGVRVESFPWDRLGKAPNLADHDVVVIDLLSREDTERLDVVSFRKMLDARTAQEVLNKRNSAIFVLGDPRFGMGRRSDGAEHDEPFLAWTGIEFAWDGRPGDTLERNWEAASGRFKPFADRLVRWRYSLAGVHPRPEEYAKFWDVELLEQGNARLAVALDAICENSYGNALVFSVAHAQERFGDEYAARLGRTEVSPLSNPIYFLPESEFAEEDALEFVLRDLCGADVSAPEPGWISEFVAPGQEEVDREIAELDGRIRGLIDEHDQKIGEWEEVRKPLKLLYETGGALEEAVWSVLGELGAEVERPEDRTKEDGWILVRVGDETLEGVLEIKGVGGRHFNLGGLRQLTDWIERGMSFRNKRYRGVFVGNSAIQEPPRERMWPFNKNWVEQAQMRGYAAIRTEDLYVLYLLDRTGRLPDREGFWRALFATEGPLDMRPYRKRLTDEERKQLGNAPE